MSKEKLTPSKMVPLNKLTRSRDTHLTNKTPSMVDLVPERKDAVPA